MATPRVRQIVRRKSKTRKKTASRNKAIPSMSPQLRKDTIRDIEAAGTKLRWIAQLKAEVATLEKSIFETMQRCNVKQLESKNATADVDRPRTNAKFEIDVNDWWEAIDGDADWDAFISALTVSTTEAKRRLTEHEVKKILRQVKAAGLGDERLSLKSKY